MEKRDKLYKYLCIVLSVLLMIMIFLYFHDGGKHIEVLNNTGTVGSESEDDNKEELQRYMTIIFLLVHKMHFMQ